MSDRNLLAEASLSDIRQKLFDLNRQGDLDAVPVTAPDDTNWLQRFRAFVGGGGPWGTAQPGQRGTFVPGKVGDDGKVSAAVPGIIQQPAEGLASLMTAPLGDIVRSGDRDAMRAAAEASFDVSSMLPAAGVAAGVAAGRTMPNNAVGMGGGRLDPPLPMDHASRMARAKDMGFDTDQVYYHGTRKQFDEFDRGKIDSNTGTGNSYGFFATTDQDQAKMFSGARGEAMPLHMRARNPLDIDLTSERFKGLGGKEFTDPMDVYDLYTRAMEVQAETGGHDAIRIKGVNKYGIPQTMAVVREPSSIRSVNAAFDPAKKNNANLLASTPDDPTTAAILALFTKQQGARQDQ